MIIDWYTVAFQIINFLILVALLRIFLYRPVLKAMDEREAAIARRQEEAAEKIAAAEEEAEAYRQKTTELRRQEESLLEKAREEADAERRSLGEKARSEMAALQKRWQESFYRQQESFVIELRRQIGKQACRIARQCLQDMADAQLEEMTWKVFIDKVETLDVEEREKLQALLTQGEYNINVRSAFEIDAAKIRQLEEKLKGLVSSEELKLHHATDPGLVCGLELEANGYRIAWTVESYLVGLEERIMKTLERAKEVIGDGGER